MGLCWLHIDVPTPVGLRTVEVTATPSKKRNQLNFSVFMRGTRSIWEGYIDSLRAGKQGALVGDRRKWERHDVSFIVRLSDDPNDDHDVQDLSVGGLQLRTRHPIEIGREVTLVLLHPKTQEAHELKARVARQLCYGSSVVGLGLAFTDTEVSRKIVEKLSSKES